MEILTASSLLHGTYLIDFMQPCSELEYEPDKRFCSIYTYETNCKNNILENEKYTKHSECIIDL